MSPTAPPPGPRWVPSWTRDQGQARASSLFKETYQAEPDGVWSAPGRLNIIGEHTDYNHGLALPTVLPHRTYVAASLRPDSTIRVVSARADVLPGPDGVWHGTLDTLSPSAVEGWPAHVAGVLWGLQERGFTGRGMDIAVASCVPIGSGLAASTALSCATALAANSLWRLALDSDAGRIELAQAGLDGDNVMAGSPTGGLAHHAILRCEPGEALLLDFATSPPHTTRYPLYFPDYGLSLLIIDTTEVHDPTRSQFIQRRQQSERAAAVLGVESLRGIESERDAWERISALEDRTLRGRARHVFSENSRTRAVISELSSTAPAHERFVTIGKHLTAAHRSLDEDFEVTTESINTVVQAALAQGALGARAIGAGFGGSAMALIRRTHAERTAAGIVQVAREAQLPTLRFLLV